MHMHLHKHSAIYADAEIYLFDNTFQVLGADWHLAWHRSMLQLANKTVVVSCNHPPSASPILSSCHRIAILSARRFCVSSAFRTLLLSHPLPRTPAVSRTVLLSHLLCLVECVCVEGVCVACIVRVFRQQVATTSYHPVYSSCCTDW